MANITPKNTEVLSSLKKGDAFSFRYYRRSSGALDTSMTWDTINELVSYCANSHPTDVFPCYKGQIVSVGSRVFVLQEIPSSTTTYDYGEFWVGANGSVVGKGNGIIALKEGNKHFYPIELANANDALNVDNLEVGTLKTTVGGIESKTGVTSHGDITTTTNITAGGNITASGNVQGDKIVGKEAEISNTSGTEKTTIKDGDITTTGDITAASITGKNNNFFLGNIDGASRLQVGVVEADKLIANLLEAKKTTYVGGRQITTVGGGTTIKRMNPTAAGYECFLNLTTYDGIGFINPFKVDDFVISQTFDLADNSQRSYWRRVTAVGSDYILLSNATADDINVSITMHDTPAAGDTICQLGHAGTDDQRKNAIVLSALASGEANGVTPPYFALYKDITSPKWPSNPPIVFSVSGNRITGDFISTSGKNLESEINSLAATAQDLGVNISNVKSQVDQTYTIWFAEAAPCNNEGTPNSSYPNNKFTDGQSEHVEDICYVVNTVSNGTSAAYRFVYDNDNHAYKWVVINDPNIIAALEKAASAQNLATSADEKADEAVSTANTASEAANSANTKATNALTDLQNMAADGVITTQEMSTITDDYNAIVSQHNELYNKAYEYKLTSSTEYTEYNSAYTSLTSVLNAIKADKSKDYKFGEGSNYTRSDFDTRWSTYYTKAENLIKKIDATTNGLIGTAQNTADKATADLGKVDRKVSTFDARIKKTEDGIDVTAGLFSTSTDEFVEGSNLSITQDFATMFTQSISEGGALNSAGLVTSSNYASVFASSGVTAAQIIAKINNDGGSEATIKAENINLCGSVFGYDEEEETMNWQITDEGRLEVYKDSEIAGWDITESGLSHSGSYDIKGDGTYESRYTLINSVGSIYSGVGVIGEVDYTTTCDWGLNYDGSGRLAKGNITWDTSGNVDIKGRIDVAKDSTIAGWSVAADAISKGNVSLGSSGNISCGNYWSLDSTGYGKLASGKITWDSSGLTVGGAVVTSDQITLSSTSGTKTNRIVLDSATNKVFSSTKEGSNTDYHWELNGNGEFFLADKKVEYKDSKLSVKGDIYADKYWMKRGSEYVEIDTMYPTEGEGSTGELTIENLTAVNINATSGTFNGAVKASAFYLNGVSMQDSEDTFTAKNHTIDPANETSTLFYRCNGVTFTLPSASSYVGLVLTFVASKVTGRASLTPCVVKTNGTDGILSSPTALGSTKPKSISFDTFVIRVMSDGTDWIVISGNEWVG